MELVRKGKGGAKRQYVFWDRLVLSKNRFLNEKNRGEEKYKKKHKSSSLQIGDSEGREATVLLSSGEEKKERRDGIVVAARLLLLLLLPPPHEKNAAAATSETKTTVRADLNRASSSWETDSRIEEMKEAIARLAAERREEEEAGSAVRCCRCCCC